MLSEKELERIEGDLDAFERSMEEGLGECPRPDYECRAQHSEEAYRFAVPELLRDRLIYQRALRNVYIHALEEGDIDDGIKWELGKAEQELQKERVIL